MSDLQITRAVAQIRTQQFLAGAKAAEELNQSSENSDIKKEGIQHTEARLGQSTQNGEESDAWTL